MSKDEIWQAIYRELDSKRYFAPSTDLEQEFQLRMFYSQLTEQDKRWLASLRIKWSA